MDSSKEAQSVAWVKWEIAAERMTLDLMPAACDEWDQRPRDLHATVQLAGAALDEIKSAFGLGTDHPPRVETPETVEALAPSFMT